MGLSQTVQKDIMMHKITKTVLFRKNSIQPLWFTSSCILRFCFVLLWYHTTADCCHIPCDVSCPVLGHTKLHSIFKWKNISVQMNSKVNSYLQSYSHFMGNVEAVTHAFTKDKVCAIKCCSIARHTVDTIFSWPNPNQWLMIYISHLTMIQR